MAPVVKELQKYPEWIRSRICVTAQHREMLDQVLELFQIEPDYDLNIMQERQVLSQVTAEVLAKLDPIIQREAPDWLLVQGDTATVMAATLVAFYNRVRVGHIEAGLRTWNKYHPFPEEISRKVTDAICDLHFAPTETAKRNLLREGVHECSIVVTGNTAIDVLLETAKREYDFGTGALASIPLDRRIVLVTAHRRENFGQPLEDICRAILTIAERYESDVHFVYPVHLNPNVQKPVHALLGGRRNISLLDPLPYLPFVHLLKRSYLVLTDSGGLQEEAPSLGKPVLVLREVTERPEAVEAGASKVVGTDGMRIVEETIRLLEDKAEYERMAQAVNPYGDGQASRRIVQALLDYSRGVGQVARRSQG